MTTYSYLPLTRAGAVTATGLIAPIYWVILSWAVLWAKAKLLGGEADLFRIEFPMNLISFIPIAWVFTLPLAWVLFGLPMWFILRTPINWRRAAGIGFLFGALTSAIAWAIEFPDQWDTPRDAIHQIAVLCLLGIAVALTVRLLIGPGRTLAEDQSSSSSNGSSGISAGGME